VLKDEPRHLTLHVIAAAAPDLSAALLPAHIDGERRLRHGQHHTAQHLLSAVFLRELGIDSISANINGYTPSTVDLDAAALAPATLQQAEDIANRLILEDRPVISHFVPSAELHALPLRRPPAVSGEVRVVEIAGYDFTPCGGSHVARTGMLGLLKLLKTERIRAGVTRLHFSAGLQSLDLFRSAHDLLYGLAASYGAAPQDLPALLQRQSEQLKTAQRDLQALQRAQIALEARRLAENAEIISPNRLVLAHFDNRPLDEFRLLASELRQTTGLVALLSAYTAPRLSVLLVCAPGTALDASALLKTLLAPYNGRGGGDSTLAQGGASVPADPHAQVFAGLRAAVSG
jgi:alanyl-tRNA synthetase